MKYIRLTQFVILGSLLTLGMLAAVPASADLGPPLGLCATVNNGSMCDPGDPCWGTLTICIYHGPYDCECKLVSE